MVEHSGSTGGYRTDIARYPSAHTSVATMCNVSNADAVGLAQRVADIVLARQVHAAGARRADARRNTARGIGGRAHAGRSGGDRGTHTTSDELNATYELSAEGTKLVLRRPRAAPDTLRPVDRQTLRGTGLTIRFPRPIGAAATKAYGGQRAGARIGVQSAQR